MKRPRIRISRRLLLALGSAALLLGAGTLGVGVLTYSQYQSRIYSVIADIPTAPVAIVFGAAIAPSGEPSSMLADRVSAAVDLYRAGKVSRILMTGDHGRSSYDEVTVMRRYAISLGVPADRINVDYAGFRTYDSCYRARAVFGVSRAILVTQRYHLPRALYLANSFGIDAVGFQAGRLSYPRQTYYNLREAAALVVTWHEVNILHPRPRYLGEPIDLESQNQG